MELFEKYSKWKDEIQLQILTPLNISRSLPNQYLRHCGIFLLHVQFCPNEGGIHQNHHAENIPLSQDCMKTRDRQPLMK